jgi:hypothetical protein
MPILPDADLRDPMPPVPGAKERAAVAARAHELGRRRRMMQGAGALGMVAAVAVGVAALTAGGSSPGTGGQHIEAASVTTDAPATTTTPVTTVPAPLPTVPAPTADTTPVAPDATQSAPPAVETAPPALPAPATFTVFGTISNIPAGATLTITLQGAGGTFSDVADGNGYVSIGGVPAGNYTGIYSWEVSDAQHVGRLDLTINANLDISFALT